MAGENVLMGSNLTPDGATFRMWAPAAYSVTVRGNFSNWEDRALVPGEQGYWYTSVPGVREGDQYKYFVKGQGSVGYKRDPYGRSRTWDPGFPNCNCFVTAPTTFPWHDAGFRPPPFERFIIYQLHVGAFFSTDAQGNDVRRERPGRFLDVLYKLEYLVYLGVTAVQLLPIQEFDTSRSLGYNGTDYYSPEVDYSVLPESRGFPSVFRQGQRVARQEGTSALQARRAELARPSS